MLDLDEKKISGFIIEDNPDALSDLKKILQSFKNIKIIGEARNGSCALEQINKLKPELVFMDIELPGLDGFKILQRCKYEPMIIFVSAYDDYAIKAFEFNGIDYVLKPVDKERLESAVSKAVKNFSLKSDLARIKEVLSYIKQKKSQESYFPVKDNDQILLIPPDDVVYFNSEDKYTFLNTYDKRYFYSLSLKKLAETLDPELFFRISQSVIISLKKLLKLKKNFLNSYEAILNDKNQASFKVSKSSLPLLKKILKINLKL